LRASLPHLAQQSIGCATRTRPQKKHQYPAADGIPNLE
jgi:hypothetical protein